MHGNCITIGCIKFHVGSLFCFNNQLIVLIQYSSVSEVHGKIDTSPCCSNIQSRPKGNEGLAALVGLAHASRAGPSHPPSGAIVSSNSVGKDDSPEYSQKHYEMLQQIACMSIRFMTMRLGGLGCILIVPHHYMPDSSP